MNERRLKLAQLFMVIYLAGCAHGAFSLHDENAVSINEVLESAERFDGQRIETAGYLEKPIVGGYYLYVDKRHARSEIFSGGLDVVVSDDRLRGAIDKFKSGQCVVISGKFKRYGKTLITIGSLSSDIGLVEVDGFKRLNCGLLSP